MSEREISVTLTEAERYEVALRYVEAMRRLADLKEEGRRILADLKRRKADAEDLAARLHDAAETGRMRRCVPCHETPDLDRGVLLVVRSDTGEVLEERGITPEEARKWRTARADAAQGGLFPAAAPETEA